MRRRRWPALSVALHQEKASAQGKTRGVAEPVLESGAFASPLQVAAERADLRSVTQKNVDGPLYNCGP